MDHIFLDVVKFSGRKIEAQVAVVNKLRDIVQGVLAQKKLTPDQVICLPTGDGLCICLRHLPIGKPVGDLQMLVARAILERLASHNAKNSKAARREYQFEVRIGINTHQDAVVKDINKNDNVAGHGINEAARVMGFGDGGHIIVSHAVHRLLIGSEKYGVNSFNQWQFTDKRGNQHTVYQYIAKGNKGLRTNPPKLLQSKPQPIQQGPGYPVAAANWAGSESLGIECIVQSELAKIVRDIHEHFGKNEAMKLMAINFRLKHQNSILADLKGKEECIKLPVRNAALYKRYVFGNIIEMLKPNYTYRTFSTMDFWMGDARAESIRKFITSNIVKASAGTLLHRVILIEPALFAEATCDIPRAEAVVDVFDKLVEQEVNTNVNITAEDTMTSLLDKALLNLFVLRSDHVEAIIETLQEDGLPNAYIQGEGQRMLVHVKETPGKDVSSTIYLEFPRDHAGFDDHERLFKKIVDHGLKRNTQLLALIAQLRKELPKWKKAQAKQLGLKRN